MLAVNDDRRVTLVWTSWAGATPDEVDIFRGSHSGFSPDRSTYYATVPGTVFRFEDEAVINGTAYYYRLVPVEQGEFGQRFSGSPANEAYGRPFDYGAVTVPAYDQHIQPLFNSSCAVHGCHVGADDATPDGLPLPRLAHGGQFSLKSWEDLFYGEKDGAVVVPFSSFKSDLVFHVNSDTMLAPVGLPHMPLPGLNLPASQVSTLIRWIDEGAKNQSGTFPFEVSPGGRVLSVCASEDLIAVLDIETGFLSRYVKVGREADPSLPFGSPHHVKVDPNGEFFYVTLINAQELWKFSAASYELLGRLPIPFQPADIALTQTGDSAYVSSFNSSAGLVTLVNTSTMQIIRSITTPFASNPHGVVLTNDGTKVFVTNAGSGNLTMINRADNSTSLVALDTLGNPFGSSVSPYLADVTPDDRFLFVTDYAPGGENVYVIDLQVDPTKPSHVIPIGGRSVHVAVTPDGSSAFVCNLDLNSVHRIQIPEFTVSTIPNVGKQPHGVAFSPDGTTAYVTTENTLTPDPPHHPSTSGAGVSFVYVIDVATLRILRSVEVGAFGQGLTVIP